MIRDSRPPAHLENVQHACDQIADVRSNFRIVL